MKIKDYKCRCGHNDFFFADKGEQKGLYCSYCGKWLKWADKDEQNLRMKRIEYGTDEKPYKLTISNGKEFKQEPCEDCISRQEVLDQTYLWSKDEFLRVTNPFDYLRKRINSLPPVNPQETVTEFADRCRECGAKYGKRG